MLIYDTIYMLHFGWYILGGDFLFLFTQFSGISNSMRYVRVVIWIYSRYAQQLNLVVEMETIDWQKDKSNNIKHNMHNMKTLCEYEE